MTNQLYIYMIILVAGILAGAYLFYLVSNFFRTKAYQDRAEFARFSEEEAEKFLQKSGYQILARHKKATVLTNVDGKDHLGYVMCDYLVKKRGKIYVAEVKSGQVGCDPLEPATRRQLLEYDYVYRPDGLLLVNMLDQKIHKVGFSFPRAVSDKFILKFAVAALFILFLFVIFWMMWQFRLF